MDRDLMVYLIEDEPLERAAIRESIEQIKGIQLLGETNNIYDAVKNIQDTLPHAIILDLELHKGSGNGLDFLRRLGQLQLPLHPYILVTTNNTSPITYEQARELGADFIMSKYQDDYCAENVVGFLCSLKKVLRHNSERHGFVSGNLATETYEQMSKRMLTRIYTELDLVGISPKAIGRSYLTEAIFIVIQGPEQNICAKIAQKNNKTDFSVERAMQNAINSAWRKTSIETLEKCYKARINSSRGVPTITEFIYYYANEIKNAY